ncbi:MAG: hypothetical protein WD696_03320 [Bryobacteraceae bacterium]
MRRSHLSLYYLAGYLTFTGVGLIAAPDLVLELLFSNRQYDDIFPRFTGVLMVGLGILVIQTIRLNLNVFYPTTLLVRAVIWAVTFGLYLYSGDPFFAVVLAVVGLGMIFTGTSYWLDKKEKHN